VDSVFPDRRATPASAQPKVAVDELRHPLSGKARRLLDKAVGYAQRGDDANAISTLRKGMAREPALIPMLTVCSASCFYVWGKTRRPFWSSMKPSTCSLTTRERI
jgi:hypothetical protein